MHTSLQIEFKVKVITYLLMSLGTINEAVYSAISPKLMLSSILILKGGADMVMKSGPVYENTPIIRLIRITGIMEIRPSAAAS